MLIERKIFLSAYAIRKLYESFKLSTKFRERSLPGLIYPAKPRRITALNAHKIEQLYDLDRPTRATVSSCDLVNLIIHSLVYCETLRDDLTVEGFFITSDRKKNRLWQMNIDTFLKLMLDVGNDYPSHTYTVRNPKTDEFAVWQGHGSPPKSFEVRAQRILKDLPDRKTN